MQLQDIRDAVISQITYLSDNQIEEVWNYLKILIESGDSRKKLLNQYLTFWCNRQLLGVRIDQIVQIISIVEITPLPDFPPYVKGIISLREEMIPVLDLRLRLWRTETPCDSHTCIIIINIQGCSFGLIVDAVNDVENIPEHEICPPPRQMNTDTSYLSGIAQRKHVTLILSIDYLLSENEISMTLNLLEDVEKMI